MARYPQDFDTDPAKAPHLDDEHDEASSAPDFDPEGNAPRRVSQQHADDADEAELAEEDILEISDLDAEDDALKGEGPDA